MLPSNGWEEKHGAEWSAAMFRKLAGLLPQLAA
jgi:hypothetical protein